MKTGVWIESSKDHPAARVILVGYVYGWDAEDDENPDTDITALAIRDLFDDPDLNWDEQDRIMFRYAGDAEEWLNANVVPDGYLFGWKDGAFYLESAQWWDEHGGPDQMWLP